MTVSSINGIPLTSLSAINGQTLSTLSHINGQEIAAGCVAVTDSFNRADSTTTLGNTDTGQPWVPVDGTWGILSNAAYIDVAGASGRSIAVVDCCPNGTVEVTFAVINNNIGLVVRCSDIDNYFILRYDGGTGTKLSKRVAGGAYSNIIGPDGNSASNGDVFKVTMSGNDFEAFKNGVSIGTVSDSFNAGVANHGIGGDGLGSTPRWDAFSYTP